MVAFQGNDPSGQIHNGCGFHDLLPFYHPHQHFQAQMLIGFCYDLLDGPIGVILDESHR